MRNAWLVGLCLCGLWLTGGCGDDDDTTPDAGAPSGDGDGDGDGDRDKGIEIAGKWTAVTRIEGEDPLETDEEITDTAWITLLGNSPIVEFDNAENYAVVRNPDDSEFDPGKYNRTNWTEIKDGTFHYCTVDFGLDTVEEARDTVLTADEGDLAEGCNGFPWTEMNPR